jgi:hypothetical protein
MLPGGSLRQSPDLETHLCGVDGANPQLAWGLLDQRSFLTENWTCSGRTLGGMLPGKLAILEMAHFLHKDDIP